MSSSLPAPQTSFKSKPPISVTMKMLSRSCTFLQSLKIPYFVSFTFVPSQFLSRKLRPFFRKPLLPFEPFLKATSGWWWRLSTPNWWTFTEFGLYWSVRGMVSFSTRSKPHDWELYLNKTSQQPWKFAIRNWYPTTKQFFNCRTIGSWFILLPCLPAMFNATTAHVMKPGGAPEHWAKTNLPGTEPDNRAQRGFITGLPASHCWKIGRSHCFEGSHQRARSPYLEQGSQREDPGDRQAAALSWC